MAYKDKYGTSWSQPPTPLEVEFSQIRKGAVHLQKNGRSLFQHMRAAISLIWPDDDHHRWSDMILKSFCENDLSVFIGCSDSTKTWTMSKIIVLDYWAFPEKTLWLVSTTEGRGAELRIWGCIKDLFNAGRSRHALPGHPIDYLKTITTEEIDAEGEVARSLRRGIIIVPCKQGGLISGLAPYIGIKAPRLRHCGDEVQAMNDAFLNAYANWYGKEDFKGMMAGNFHYTDDPLGIASEPIDGWDSFVDSGKTQQWRGKFYQAQISALDGRDSPNFDAPWYVPGGPPHFPYMIGEKKLKGVSETKGKDSFEWHSQCVGKPLPGMDIWRVLNRPFCRSHHALDDVVWKGSPRTRIYGLDPAYGGGDRCVGRMVEFGEDLSGNIILKVGAPEIIKISPVNNIDPEDQIADYVKNRLAELSVPAKNCFYDSFGRGTLGYSFSRVMGTDCPIPVDSSGECSSRPVRFDLFVETRPGARRLKRCDEHYKKFISELWFTVRETIEAEQIRNLDVETMTEGCARKFTNEPRIEVEPKQEMKERLNRSPDLFDNLAICLEGARQRGFKIRGSDKKIVVERGPDWLDKRVVEERQMLRERQLENA
jgi:hypothetical protein